MILHSTIIPEFKLHPEGIFPAVCVDLIDLGLVEEEYLGQRRLAHKVRLVFETEHANDGPRNATLARTFTASLNPKATLPAFLGQWRGRPILPGETLDLKKVLGVCCTLVISHRQSRTGRTYASIDAISKPTKKITASGHYDAALARQRIAEWKAREVGNPKPEIRNPNGNDGTQGTQAAPAPANLARPEPAADPDAMPF